MACVSPTMDSAEETLGTLRFATCATHVQNRTEQAGQEAMEERLCTGVGHIGFSAGLPCLGVSSIDTSYQFGVEFDTV